MKLSLVKKNNPSNVRYEGTLSFTEEIDLEVVKKAVSLSDGSRSVPLSWQIPLHIRRVLNMI